MLNDTTLREHGECLMTQHDTTLREHGECLMIQH